MNTTSKLLLTGLISVVMTGCNNQSSTTTGSSTNTSPTTSSPSADTSEPSVAVTQASVIQALGEIDGFGSVIVNGKHYETDNAEITVDGEPALEESLDTGMIVEVIAEEGQDGKIHAKEVRFSSKIAGDRKSVV